MKLEIGMYCYNKTNRKMGIGKIKDFKNNNNVLVIYKNKIQLVSKGNIIASFDIIDLIDTGDYVNGLPIQKINKYLSTNEKYLDLLGSCSDWENEDIKSVVTKEQFECMKCRIGDNR